MTEHRIEIATSPEGFAVNVVPPIEGEDFDREFPTHRSARGYAGGLRLARRWGIIDRTCGGIDGPTQG